MRRSKKKILLLVHRLLVPPRRVVARDRVMKSEWRTEYDVLKALLSLGHTVEVVGLEHDLGPLRERLWSFKPDVVFNLLEEFKGEGLFESNIVAYLEMAGFPFTGCGSKGLMLARDKALAKKIVTYHRVRTPAFHVFFKNKPILWSDFNLKFPVIVKSATEEASMGISRTSVVEDRKGLTREIRRVWSENNDDALVEEYIEGREIYASVIVKGGSVKLLPLREMVFGRLPKNQPRIATERIKWDLNYRQKYGVFTRRLPNTRASWLERLEQDIKIISSALSLRGYGRLDFRLSSEGEIYFIEANPNPQIAVGEDFADSARLAGLNYEQLINELIKNALEKA